MKGTEFIRRARRYARKTEQPYRFEAGHGKGSHGRLYIGAAFTTVKRSEIAPALFAEMLKQLNIRKEDFEMRYAFPCTLTPNENGIYLVQFPDVPEALTDGASRAEALTMAADALAVALAGYVLGRRDIPVPGALAKGQDLVPVPPVTAAKLALYAAMREQRVTKTALAARLGISEAAVRKLTNPDHRSHIGRVEAALKALGRTLVVEDKAA